MRGTRSTLLAVLTLALALSFASPAAAATGEEDAPAGETPAEKQPAGGETGEGVGGETGGGVGGETGGGVGGETGGGVGGETGGGDGTAGDGGSDEGDGAGTPTGPVTGPQESGGGTSTPPTSTPGRPSKTTAPAEPAERTPSSDGAGSDGFAPVNTGNEPDGVQTAVPTPTPSPTPTLLPARTATQMPVAPEQNRPLLSGFEASTGVAEPRSDIVALIALFGSLAAAAAVAVGRLVYQRFFQHRLP